MLFAFFLIFKTELSPSIGFRSVNSLARSGTLINISMSYKGLNKTEHEMDIASFKDFVAPFKNLHPRNNETVLKIINVTFLSGFLALMS